MDLGAWASDASVVPGRAVESDDEVPPGRPATDPDGR
ncbi:MAG: hypothetical protein AB7G13_30435 [Lautropia sp.]